MIKNEEGYTVHKFWSGMTYDELKDLKLKLIASGSYSTHVKEIKEELVHRFPPTVETIAEVTIKSKL